MKTQVVLAFLLFCIGCKVVNVNGYTKLTGDEKKAISPFSIDSVNVNIDYSKRFAIEEITGPDVEKIIKRQKYTWVFLWAPWCNSFDPGYFKGIQKFEDSLNGDLKIVVVAISYDLDYVIDMLKKSNYKSLIYVLDNSRYGEYMTRSQTMFNNEIDKSKLFKKDKYATHYFFENEKLIWADYTADTATISKLIR
jgi:hypothetical protein